VRALPLPALPAVAERPSVSAAKSRFRPPAKRPI